MSFKQQWDAFIDKYRHVLIGKNPGALFGKDRDALLGKDRDGVAGRAGAPPEHDPVSEPGSPGTR